jgi:hypothetical protein
VFGKERVPRSSPSNAGNELLYTRRFAVSNSLHGMANAMIEDGQGVVEQDPAQSAGVDVPPTSSGGGPQVTT